MSNSRRKTITKKSFLKPIFLGKKQIKKEYFFKCLAYGIYSITIFYGYTTILYYALFAYRNVDAIARATSLSPSIQIRYTFLLT